MESPDPSPGWPALSSYLARKDELKSSPRGSMLTERLYNRDLSWLQFNDRVLREAADPNVPALERLRFIAIASSNLDEFFMVRVADINRIAQRAAKHQYPDGMDVRQLLSQVREQVLYQKSLQAQATKDVFETLSKQGINILFDFREDKSADRDLRGRLSNAPTILRRSTELMPDIESQRIYVFVRFPAEYAIIDVGRRSDRLIELPAEGAATRFALADRWIAARAAELFGRKDVIEAFPFKVLRDAELDYRLDEEESLEKQIVEELRRRPREAKIIRLEVDSSDYSEGALFIASQLGIDSSSLYRFDLPLDMRTLAKIYDTPGKDRLRYPVVKPQTPPFLRKADIFTAMKEGDILLHHPYDSFDIVVRFLERAAEDPHVTHIYHSLYRTSSASPIINALEKAAQSGKKVTAYIEIRARFDELANVQWAEHLRKSGVRVVRPLGGYKVHSKITRVTRVENDTERVYTHLGTGNYHPGTARQYTDLGLLTADEQIGRECGDFFKALSKREKPSGYQDLLVAPGNLHDQFTKLIRNETHIQKSGGRGRIQAKMNSLVDPDIIDALYEASGAGVKIDLIVRGICCLRPGIPGLSENIRVVSVIDRFLEHSRIYYFRNGGGGGDLVYLSSADWMPRNFYTRYEIAFPVKDALLKRFIRDVVLNTSLQDNVKSWLLNPDGAYKKEPIAPTAARVRSQDVFQQLARHNYRGTPIETRFIKPK